MKLKVSIAMACYNSEEFIKAAIKSIFRQTYKNWELIIVDDNSTDKSYQTVVGLINKLGCSNKIKIFKHDRNYGYGRTLKDAIEKGGGQLIAIVDSDDALSSKDALQIMVTEHIKHPRASLVYSNYIICDAQLRSLKRAPSRQIKKSESYINTKIRISHLKVIKRNFYNKTEGVDESLLKAVDKDLVLKLEEVGELIYVNKCLYYYRRHKKNLTNSLGKSVCARMRRKIYKNARIRRGLE